MESNLAIITVNYNSGRKLLETVQSVANQTVSPIQHIIKDAQSEDGSVDLISEYSTRNEVTVLVQKDRSIYDGMNQALEICTAKFVYFLNAGDEFMDNGAVEILSGFINRNMAHCDCFYFDYFNKETGVISNLPNEISDFYLYRRGGICHQSYLLRADLLKEVGCFDINWIVSAEKDVFFKLRNGRKFRSIKIDKVLCSYEGSGFSSKMDLRTVSKYRRIWRRKYFSAWQRVFYGFVVFLSMESLRVRLVKRYPKLYHTVAKGILSPRLTR